MSDNFLFCLGVMCDLYHRKSKDFQTKVPLWIVVSKKIIRGFEEPVCIYRWFLLIIKRSVQLFIKFTRPLGYVLCEVAYHLSLRG